MSNIICGKLLTREKNKYRKITSSNNSIFSNFNLTNSNIYNYNPDTILEQGDYFYIENFIEKEYCIDLIKNNFSSVDFDNINKRDFNKLDYIFVYSENYIFFQRVSKSNLISKKRLISFGDKFEYKDDAYEITINNYPDAIYDKEKNILYFYKLENITRIFKGIDILYREATEEETANFLQSDFISLDKGFSSNNVNKLNRKKIAIAIDFLKNLNQEEIQNLFSYIDSYCENIEFSDGLFIISSNKDLQSLLAGIQQRFYTTPIDNEKRFANSVINI